MTDINTSGVTVGPCVNCAQPVQRPDLPGIFSTILEAVPLRCTTCDAKTSEQWTAEDRARQENALAARHTERVRRSDLPAALLDVDLDTLDRTGCSVAIDSARYWALRGGGLLLTGPFGTGKTTIAAGALVLALERRAGRWLSAPLLMARLGFGFGSREYADVLKTIMASTALVVDDLDKTRPTEYGAEQIFNAVDGAIASGRPLLVTTNLKISQLAGKWPEPFGEAIASRLRGYCKVVEVTGRDRRLSGPRDTGATA